MIGMIYDSPCTSNSKGFCKSSIGQYEMFPLHPSFLINKHRLQVTSHSLSHRDVDMDSTILIQVATEIGNTVFFKYHTPGLFWKSKCALC